MGSLKNLRFFDAFLMARISCRLCGNSVGPTFARVLDSNFEASDRSEFSLKRKSAFWSPVFAQIASFRTVCLIFAPFPDGSRSRRPAGRDTARASINKAGLRGFGAAVLGAAAADVAAVAVSVSGSSRP
jgi:hypothetical protein